MNNQALGRKLTAICLAAAVLCVSSMVTLAAPGNSPSKLTLGEVTTSGVVSINGEQAFSGGTIFPDSTISTTEKASATINLGKLGQTFLSQNSSMRIGFTESSNIVSLDSGRVRVSVPAGYAGSVLTKDGSVIADKEQAAVFTVDVTGGKTFISTQEGRVEFRAGRDVRTIGAGQELLVGAGAPTTAAVDDDSKKKALWILLGVGIGITILVLVLTNDDEETTPVASPIT